MDLNPVAEKRRAHLYIASQCVRRDFAPGPQRKNADMAIFHYSSSILSRSKGQNAIASASYQSAALLIDQRTGEEKDYRRKESVDYVEILAPENAPEWVTDRERLWNEVEAAEKRKDAQLARKMDVALPRELTPDEQRELVRRFVQEEFVNRGQIADVAIHDAKGKNPHAHVMLTTREIGPEGFGKKCREWNPAFKGQGFAKGEKLTVERATWAAYCNRALQERGHEARIDHRRLEDQGVERVPQIHLGPRPGPARLAEAQERREINERLVEHRAELLRAQAELREIAAVLEKSRQQKDQVNQVAPNREAGRGPEGQRTPLKGPGVARGPEPAPTEQEAKQAHLQAVQRRATKSVYAEWFRQELAKTGHAEVVRNYDWSIERAKDEMRQIRREARSVGMLGALIGKRRRLERSAQEAEAKASRLEADKAERVKMARKAAMMGIRRKLATPDGRESFKAEVAKITRGQSKSHLEKFREKKGRERSGRSRGRGRGRGD